MKLKPFDFSAAVARAGLGVNGQPLTRTGRIGGDATSTTGVKGVEGGFGQALSAALKGVSDASNDAAEMQRQVQLDNPNVSLEGTMIAMQKAQIGFQATLQVRNKLVQAYSDIMNMQV